MRPLLQRAAFTVAITLLAAAAASGGVLAWRAMNPVPVAQPVPAASPAPGTAVAVAHDQGLKVGDRRPDFSLPDLEGRSRSVSEWDGKLLFVNFWATWCPPCLEEIPAFVRLQQRHAGDGVQFVGVALDSAENVRAFVAEHGVNYPSLHGEQEAIVLTRSYGNRIGALPYTVVVGRDGNVLKMHQGILDEAEAERIIEQSR